MNPEAIHLGATLEKKSDAPLWASWGLWLECHGEAGYLEMRKGTRTGFRCLKGRCSSYSSGGFCVPTVEVDVWAGSNNPSPDPTEPNWAFVRCLIRVYWVNILLGSWEDKGACCQGREGPLCVCTQGWDLGAGFEGTESRTLFMEREVTFQAQGAKGGLHVPQSVSE